MEWKDPKYPYYIAFLRLPINTRSSGSRSAMTSAHFSVVSVLTVNNTKMYGFVRLHLVFPSGLVYDPFDPTGNGCTTESHVPRRYYDHIIDEGTKESRHVHQACKSCTPMVTVETTPIRQTIVTSHTVQHNLNVLF